MSKGVEESSAFVGGGDAKLICRSGGIGRPSGFRFQRPKGQCRFDSDLRYQNKVCETARRSCLPVTEDIDRFESGTHRQNLKRKMT